MECERERDRRGEGRAGSYMVPRNPAREVADPVALGVGAVRFDPRQRFVSWHVVGDGQQYRAAEVQRAADEEVGDKGFVPREERSHRQDATSSASPSFNFTQCKLTHCKVTLYFMACQVANRKPGRVFLRLRDG
jgi:hypothetical protein